MHFDLVQIIQTVGYIGLFAIVFAESGLFFGFFLPGDSLLLTAGLLASQGKLDIGILLVILSIAAILGDNVGYWFGKKTGSRIFSRDESLLFRRKNLLAAQAFYDRHGGKTIVLARFIPFIRTFAPIVAGAVEMPFRRFFTFNLVGGSAVGRRRDTGGLLSWPDDPGHRSLLPGCRRGGDPGLGAAGRDPHGEGIRPGRPSPGLGTPGFRLGPRRAGERARRSGVRCCRTSRPARA